MGREEAFIAALRMGRGTVQLLLVEPTGACESDAGAFARNRTVTLRMSHPPLQALVADDRHSCPGRAMTCQRSLHCEIEALSYSERYSDIRDEMEKHGRRKCAWHITVAAHFRFPSEGSGAL